MLKYIDFTTPSNHLPPFTFPLQETQAILKFSKDGFSKKRKAERKFCAREKKSFYAFAYVLEIQHIICLINNLIKRNNKKRKKCVSVCVCVLINKNNKRMGVCCEISTKEGKNNFHIQASTEFF